MKVCIFMMIRQKSRKGQVIISLPERLKKWTLMFLLMIGTRKKKNKGSYADILVSKNIGVFYLGEKKTGKK